MRTVLSADLGGTKTLLSLKTYDGDKSHGQREETFVSSQFSHLSEMIQLFRNNEDIDAACFAVAGPVNQHQSYQTAKITNLPWALDSRELKTELCIPSVKIVNDFEAIGYGIESLSRQSIITIQQGSPLPKANRAIIGAGTGLGQGFMVHNIDGYKVHACEGGHVDFAPNSDEETHLLTFLQQKYGHVSYERILSGSGLQNIYDFLKTEYPETIDPEFDSSLNETDGPALISKKGLEESEHIATKALRIFVTIYGAQAGNMALNYNSRAGVYIAGGIAAKIKPVMESELFRKAFNNKGRMSELTQKTPVYLITDAKVGLYGAENLARRSIA